MWFYRDDGLAIAGTTGPNDRPEEAREVEQYLSERPGKGLFAGGDGCFPAPFFCSGPGWSMHGGIDFFTRAW